MEQARKSGREVWASREMLRDREERDMHGGQRGRQGRGDMERWFGRQGKQERAAGVRGSDSADNNTD